MKSELQVEYEDLLRSVEFVDPSSYMILSKNRFNNGWIKTEKTLNSIQSILDTMFSGINDYNRVYVQTNRNLVKNSRGGLKYTYDFNEEFFEDNLENRIKFIKALLPLSLNELIIFSEIGHCSKRGHLRSVLYPCGKIVDRYKFDLQIIDSRDDENFLSTHKLSKEQFNQIISSKWDDSKNLKFLRRI